MLCGRWGGGGAECVAYLHGGFGRRSVDEVCELFGYGVGEEVGGWCGGVWRGVGSLGGWETGGFGEGVGGAYVRRRGDGGAGWWCWEWGSWRMVLGKEEDECLGVLVLVMLLIFLPRALPERFVFLMFFGGVEDGLSPRY